jgi:hypothetical protein
VRDPVWVFGTGFGMDRLPRFELSRWPIGRDAKI